MRMIRTVCEDEGERMCGVSWRGVDGVDQVDLVDGVTEPHTNCARVSARAFTCVYLRFDF